MSEILKKFNEERRQDYYKNPLNEDFLLRMNLLLQEEESNVYKDYQIKHPFLFVFGVPRSGTTLISQLLAYSLESGYINNIAARFWLAPIHGIRVSKTILGNTKLKGFQSDYARTTNISDIHEFGYFWRYWLKKETLEDIVNVKSLEGNIDWSNLKKTLSSIQQEFNKPMVFKNILGAYHMPKFIDLLEKVLFIYIERDPLDTAISILNARKKYYGDLSKWWSYAPVEYDIIKDLNYWEQIAGQIHYLKRFYQQEIDLIDKEYVLRVKYEDLCNNPKEVLERVQKRAKQQFKYEIKIENEPPTFFHFNKYENRNDEKEKFNELLQKLNAKDS